MKQKLLAIVLLILYVIATSCSKEPIEEPSTLNFQEMNLSENNWTFAEDILYWVNEYRNTHGRTALKMDRDLASHIALFHSEYMISKNRISHDDFSKRAQRLKAEGAKSIGENVASGFDNAEILVRAWIQSPTHKQVLDGNYTKAGFGIKEDDGGKTFVTLLCYR